MDKDIDELKEDRIEVFYNLYCIGKDLEKIQSDLIELETDLAWTGHKFKMLQKRLSYQQIKVQQMTLINERKIHTRVIETLKKMNKKLFM
jgi:soluble P-type ATPase